MMGMKIGHLVHIGDITLGISAGMKEKSTSFSFYITLINTEWFLSFHSSLTLSRSIANNCLI